MFIAILDFRTSASDRPAALAHLDGEGDRVRAMPGNLAYRVYAASQDDTAVAVVPDGGRGFVRGYLASDPSPERGGAPTDNGRRAGERRFHADLLETVA